MDHSRTKRRDRTPAYDGRSPDHSVYSYTDTAGNQQRNFVVCASFLVES